MGSIQKLYIGNYIKADFSKIDFYDILDDESLDNEFLDIIEENFTIAGEDFVDSKGYSYILSVNDNEDGKYVDLQQMDGEESFPEKEWNENWKVLCDVLTNHKVKWEVKSGIVFYLE